VAVHVPLDLELMHAARAAGRLQVAELAWGRRIRDVPEHQAVLGVRIVARAPAPLDACGRDVATIVRGVDDDVLCGGAGRVLQRRDPRRTGCVDLEHGDTALRGLRAEAILRPTRPVLETPVPDVRVPLVRPDVAVKASVAERVVGDNLEVRRDLDPLLAALVRLVGLLEEVLLVLEQLVVVRGRGHSHARERQRRGRKAQRDERLSLQHLRHSPESLALVASIGGMRPESAGACAEVEQLAEGALPPTGKRNSG
jgi:hypothetical protein